MKGNLVWLAGILALLAVAASLLAPRTSPSPTFSSSPTPRQPPANSTLPPGVIRYEIDLTQDKVAPTDGLPLQWVEPPRAGKGVLRLTLDPSLPYRRAHFVLRYGAAPQGFTFNLADSSTCNGFGGDSGTQSNDAEVMILDGVLSLWGNDQHPGKIDQVEGFFGGKALVQLEAGDGLLDATGGGLDGGRKQWKNPGLFCLAGQPDREGPVNYDLYAGFNRVVAGGREGVGLEQVTVEFLP